MAEMYYEASRRIPISFVNLQGLFDYEARDTNYWTTTAGMGQALACAQQVAFTLELSLKALLEACGKLVTKPKKEWEIHDLSKLYGFLDSPEQNLLEQQWQAIPLSNRSDYNNLSEFLTATKNLYVDFRYVPTLKSTNLEMDIRAMLNASLILLSRSKSLAMQLSPIKPRVSISTSYQPAGDMVDATADRQNVLVGGTVVSVKTPDDFDSNGFVEVVVHPTYYFNGLEQITCDGDVTAIFSRCAVESYFGLEGEEVVLGGWATAAEPSMLRHAQHVDSVDRMASYRVETRTLKGQAYNLIVRETSYNDSTRVTLILRDMTFLSDVDCLFVTEEEKAAVENVALGAEVTIRGHVTLLNGRPVSLVGPSLVN